MEKPEAAELPPVEPQGDAAPDGDGDADGGFPADAAAAGVTLPTARDAEAQAKLEREAFERITGKKLKGDSDEIEEAPPEGLEDVDDEPPADEQGPAAGQSRRQAADKPQDQPEDAEAMREVVRAYLRDGHTTEQVERIRKALGDDEFIATGQVKVKRQGDIDNKLGSTKPPAAESKPAKQVDQPPAEDAELERVLSDLYDDAAAGKVRQHVSGLKDQVKQTQAAMASLVSVLAQSLMDAGVQSLSSSIPQVADQRHRAALMEEMARLTPEGWMPRNQAEFNEVLKRAAYVQFGQQLENNAKARLIAASRRERNGQPTTPARNVPKGAMTKEQAEYAAFMAIKKGRDPSKVIASYRNGS